MQQERRSEMRNMCADMLEVSWRDRLGKTRKTTALLEDISACGACLQFEAEIPLGSEVRWEWPSQSFTGRVRYCTYQEIGYFVGIQFDSAIRWSEEGYTPRHMLNLGKLV
jgi:hypothetical protein